MSAAPLAYTQDFMLAQRAVEGEARAEKQLAQRLIVRVRRAAHALLGGAPEADDAAQHALVELLRSMRSYPGETSLESWADRLAARSLVRFARAVRARKASVEPPPRAFEGERPERFARTLEEFLRELPSAQREALLLREAFGFDLVETAQLMRSSTRAIREHLSQARQSLYLRSSKDIVPSDALPQPIERWFALRDRAEAATAASAKDPESTLSDALSAAEHEELGALTAQPELRKLQKELRGLPQFVEGGRFGRLSQRDKKLLEGALASVRVSAISTNQALPHEAARETDTDAIDTSWVQPISLGLCVMLVVAAFAALAVRAPEAALPALPASLPRADAQRAPTVEALSSAQAAERGARLSRAGKPLEQGMSLREGDVVSADARAGCFGLSPRADVCLAASSEARIATLGLSARRVELLRGRAVASVERIEPGVPFALSVHALRVETSDGVLGFELDGDQVVVRVLRGSTVVATPGGGHVLGAAQSAIYRTRTGQLEVVPQLVEKARRDWDLLATRTLNQAVARTPSAKAEPLAGSTAATRELATPPDEGTGAAPAAVGEHEVALVATEPVAALATTIAAHEEDSRTTNLEAEGHSSEREQDPAASAEGPQAATSQAGGGAEDLLARAKDASRARRFAEAAQLYLDLIRAFPSGRSSREALVLRGELLSERLREPAEAIALFDRYLATGGGMLAIRARYGRILALRHLNRAAEERAATQEFLFSHGNTSQARLLRARPVATTP